MDKERLDEIVAIHGRWIQDKGGKHADLRCANFKGADLSFADLRFADLRGANFEGADLTGANLSWSDITGANFKGVTMTLDRAVTDYLTNKGECVFVIEG